MIARLPILLLALMSACTAGPESPERYRRFGPETTLRFNFKDPPAGEVITMASLILGLVSFQPSVEAPSGECGLSSSIATLKPFIADGAQFRIPSINTLYPYYQSESCAQQYPQSLHFLKVHAELTVSSGGAYLVPNIGHWTLGAYDLVYAHSDTTFRPFGPTGAAATIPEGYSWLHRTCGVAGNTELSVVPISETLDLYRGGRIMTPPTGFGSMSTTEAIERSLATCGGPPPTWDLGIRVSFDCAKDLLWSADGTSLFYLAPDEQDPNGAVGVRQVKILEHTTSDIAVVNHASALQTGATGVLYVTADATTYAVSSAPGVPATLQPLPFTGTPHLSPDGLWFAYEGGGAVNLWSVAASADSAMVPGRFVAWSPDSRLLYGPVVVSAPYPMSVVSPSAPEQSVSCGAPSDLLRSHGHLAWQSECPQVAYAPSGWSIESTVPYPACENCFGVSLQDPVTGLERPLLEDSAGMVHLIDTHPVADSVFTWARTCQGLYNTVCTHSLLRIRLASGTAETIAVADQEVPIALSWDNRKLAFAASNGIYVKELPQ